MLLDLHLLCLVAPNSYQIVMDGVKSKPEAEITAVLGLSKLSDPGVSAYIYKADESAEPRMIDLM